jgi:hypothetical protein
MNKTSKSIILSLVMMLSYWNASGQEIETKILLSTLDFPTVRQNNPIVVVDSKTLRFSFQMPYWHECTTSGIPIYQINPSNNWIGIKSIEEMIRDAGNRP